MANWKQGGQGKGSDGSRINHEKLSEGMDNIKDQEWKSCGGCKFFQGGFDVLGYTLCSEVDKFDLNKGVACSEWVAR